MTKYCPNCKIEVETGKFCPECGTKLEDIQSEFFCPECGKVYNHGKFCPECGVKLEERRKTEGEVKAASELSSSLATIECPVCGFENPAGSKECAGCGFPLESATIDNVISSDSATESEDEAILAKYSDEFDDMRELNEEEAPVAIEEIKKIAEKGNPKAETFLAYLYFDGKYIEQDYQKSYDLLSDAENKGYVLASAYKAMFFVQGILVNRDLDEAERLIEPALDIPPAMYIKGMICLSRDEEDEAVRWFKKAADNGDDNALTYLGIAYLQGTGGVPLDPVRAFECFNKSAALGNAEAENMLGVCYQNGQGTEPDEEQALYWYQEAVKHNDPDAQNNLANCYKNGWLGLAADPEKAFELYKKAAEQENVDAMFEVAEYYDANYLTAQKSVEWYQKAADAGHGDAMFELAQKYENGWNVEKDPAKAKEYYAKAAEAGCERAVQQEEKNHSYMNWLDETGQRFRDDTPDDAYKAFIEGLQEDASNGLDLAQKLLGNCYYAGKGVKEDYKEGVKWFRKAAEQGNVIAQFNLGIAYFNGQGVSHDDVEAVKWFRKAAEKGYAGAQNSLGYCYAEGRGVEHDDTKAAKCYRKAAEQGIADAQNNLAICYVNGLGVKQNYTEALKWYRKAADQGYAVSQSNLASFYFNGEGIKQDYSEAIMWYQKAAEQGYPYALYSLGRMYEEGKGVAHDREKAIELLTSASEAGSEDARQYLLNLKGNNNDNNSPITKAYSAMNSNNYEEAIRILRKLSNSGDAEAQFELSKCYQNGTGVNKNTSVAASWLNKSAELGYLPALFALGQRNELGIDITPNQEQAAKWYRKAAEQGHLESQFRLGVMYNEGRGVKQNDKKAIDLLKKAADNGLKEAKEYIASLKDKPTAIIKKMWIETDINYSSTRRGLRFHIDFEVHNIKNKEFNCSINLFYDWGRNPGKILVYNTDPQELSVDGSLVVGESQRAEYNDVVCNDWRFEVPYYLLCNHDSKGTWPIVAKVIIFDMSGKKATELKTFNKKFSITYSKKLFSDPTYDVVVR